MADDLFVLPMHDRLESVIMRCPESCGEMLTLPAELISNEPASGGAIVATIRITGTAELQQHVEAHWGPLPEE